MQRRRPGTGDTGAGVKKVCHKWQSMAHVCEKEETWEKHEDAKNLIIIIILKYYI